MFYRGQRIIVKESSAKKRAHPNVEDVGYMGSAFLFYKERFILIDAEFFSYPGYSPGERKGERKRFILDLGMKSSFRRKSILNGHSINWYTHNQCVVNLNPIDTLLSVSWNDRPSLAGLWPSAYEMSMFSKGHSNRLGASTKIPVGRISSMNGNKYSMGKHGMNDIRAWMRVMSPVIDISYRVGDSETSESDEVLHRLYKLYRHIREYVILKKEYGATQQYLFEWSEHAVTSKPRREAVITAVKYMQAINAMQRLKQEGFMAKHYIGDQVMPAMVDIVQRYGVKELINGGIKTRDGSKAWDIITSILFRALVMPGNTHNRLLLIKNIFSPDNTEFNSQWCEKRSEAIDKVKEEAESDSAALTRIFDGTLIS